MTDSAADIVWYKWAGSTGGYGLSEAHRVHAQAAHGSNTVQRSADGSLTITYEPTGHTTVYLPATAEEAEEIMRQNKARIEGNARLGTAVAKLLRAAGIQMARWNQVGGSGVYVHTSGGHVKVWWWFSTDAERSDAPGPWTGGADGGARAQVVAALEGAGICYSYESDDLVLTSDDNPQI